MLGNSLNPSCEIQRAALHDFFKKIEQQSLTVNHLGISKELNHYINAEDLSQVYGYVLNNQALIANHFNSIDPNNEAQEPLRIAKMPPFLKHTINIVQDLNGKYILFLETKSKLASGLKDPQAIVYSGGKKWGKNNWRIDVYPPIPYVNMMIKREDLEDILNENEEVFLSQLLIKDLPNASNAPISYLLMGPTYSKRDKVSLKLMFYQNYFSLRAGLGDLANFLNNYEYLLTNELKCKIASDLLQAVKLVHDKNCVQQDIKMENVLVFKEGDQYHFKLMDFGLATPLVSNTMNATSTLGYESPEISLAWAEPSHENYAYFHNPYHYSYGRLVSDKLTKEDKDRTYSCKRAINYREPHKANDMWALGIVLFKIFTLKMCLSDSNEDKIFIAQHPLLKGLLDHDRKTRSTIEQAQEDFRKMMASSSKPKRIYEFPQDELPTAKKIKLEAKAQKPN